MDAGSSSGGHDGGTQANPDAAAAVDGSTPGSNPPHGGTSTSGCDFAASGGDGSGLIVVFGLLLVAVAPRIRRTGP